MPNNGNNKDFHRWVELGLALLAKQDITKTYVRFFWLQQALVLAVAVMKLLFVAVIFFLVFGAFSKHTRSGASVPATQTQSAVQRSVAPDTQALAQKRADAMRTFISDGSSGSDRGLEQHD